MKRVFSAICAAAFACVACQETLPQPEAVVEYQEVSFAVNVADAETKATATPGDGSLATNLDFAVYHNSTWISSVSPALNSEVEETEEGWQVTLTLAKNVVYDVVFWAYADNAPYTFDKANHKIIVDYGTQAAPLPANDETRDAFIKCCSGYTVTDTPVDVDLTRPFAQINIGASDYIPYITDFGFDMTSTIRCAAPSVLDVLTGAVSEEVEVEFLSLATIPYEDGNEVLTTVDNVTYHWMSMNYILAAESKSNIYGDIEATFRYNDQNLVIEIPSVPYRRNYKTNILGNIFTGNAKFDVVVVPGFAGTNNHNIGE